jgi:catechol 2,3-dioxygenase-like lactoylglutathione lyase family enzyme
MEPELVIARAELAAPAGRIDALAAFYGETLGLPVTDRATVDIGGSALAFAPADGEPFHHVALLVPGDRFAAAHAWLGERVPILPSQDGSTVFDFSFWDAEACYFHDPAGNIMELIAHRGLAERGGAGPFEAGELAAISEVGVVTPRPADAVTTLERELGLPLWSGAVEAEGGLGFVGRKAHTLVISGTGRGWLPTGRPAEPHAATVTFTGASADQAVELPGTPARVARRA